MELLAYVLLVLIEHFSRNLYLVVHYYNLTHRICFCSQKTAVLVLWHVFNLENFFGEIHLLVSSVLLVISINCSSLLLLLNHGKGLILFDCKQSRRWFLISHWSYIISAGLFPTARSVAYAIAKSSQSTLPFWRAGKVTCRISGIVKSQE